MTLASTDPMLDDMHASKFSVSEINSWMVARLVTSWLVTYNSTKQLKRCIYNLLTTVTIVGHIKLSQASYIYKAKMYYKYVTTTCTTLSNFLFIVTIARTQHDLARTMWLVRLWTGRHCHLNQSVKAVCRDLNTTQSWINNWVASLAFPTCSALCMV